MKICIQDVCLVPMDGRMPIENAQVHIQDNTLQYAGETDKAPAFSADRVIQGRKRICMPGLVNTHTHLSMTLLRGMGSDLPLQEWLEKAIFPLEDKLDGPACYYGALWGIAEALRYGVTSVNDMYMFMEDVATAVKDSGIRARLSRGIVGKEYDDPQTRLRIDETLQLSENWHGKENNRIRVCFAPHSEYLTSPALLKALRGIGAANGFHIHTSETQKDHQECLERHGITQVQLFEECGLLGERTVLAHCVHITSADMDRLADTGTSVAHCPVSNLKLASGTAPVWQMMQRGITVGLGTDGVASNNSMDLFEELRLLPLLQKGGLLDSTALPALKALECATTLGAAAMDNPDIGALSPGKRADLILLDVDGLSAYPMVDPLTHIVFSAKGNDVSLTMVDGQVLYEEGAFPTLDMKELRKGFDAALKRIKG